jgi:hypothetical protein
MVSLMSCLQTMTLWRSLRLLLIMMELLDQLPTVHPCLANQQHQLRHRRINLISFIFCNFGGGLYQYIFVCYGCIHVFDGGGSQSCCTISTISHFCL